MTRPLILCATTRLAQTLRGEVPVAAQVWQTTPALTLNQWLAQLAEEALLTGSADLPSALDPFAEQLLWEQVIASAMANGEAPLFDIQGMAAAALEAHALIQQWDLSLDGSTHSDETRWFLTWQNEFLRRCRAAHWCDLVGQQIAVIQLIADGQLPIPGQILWAGFDRATPLENRLKAALRHRAVAMDELPTGLKAAADDLQVIAYPDLQAECQAAAEWAAQHLALDPARRLGVVVPDLAGARDSLAFALENRLHPALIRPAAAASARDFNLSLGRPLADQVLVQSALELLSLAGGGKLEQRRISALLNAPCWSAALSEADGRARLDAAMRRSLPFYTRLPALLRLGEWLASQDQPHAPPHSPPHAPSLCPPLCPQTLANLAALHAAAEACGGRQRSVAEWATHFAHWLKQAAWPGERRLSSHEFQARRAFLETLDSLAKLDSVLGPVAPQEAWRRLSQLCRQRVFQPETQGQPRIQVLGTLESAGLQCDALWVMGLNDEIWPPAPRPNPLLPADLLRRNGVAKSSAEVELDFARCVHQRLLRAAPTITFSYAQNDGARLLRPSPLLAGIKPVSPAPIPPTRLAWQMLASALGTITSSATNSAICTPGTPASKAISPARPRETLMSTVRPELVEGQLPQNQGLRQAQPEREGMNQRRPSMLPAMARLADAQAPAVAEGEKVSGGTWLLRAQAICPAWAYFQFRLGAELMEQPVEGLDPRARGTLVHGALEAFWRLAVDSATLHAYTEAVLHAAIGEAVAQAIADFEQQRHQALPTRFRQLEAGRLERLLATWLALEKQRPLPFEVIACEQEAVVEIEKIRVKMFVDRIDQLADGRCVIIDYKTGAVIDTKNWASERITEPQLPIYAAIASDAPVAAVVFAKVLADKPAFSGIAEQGDVLPGVRALDDPKEKRFAAAQFPDWPALIAHWHERLHAIAREVREGVAGVTVADENALAYCPVLPLLRLAEREQLLAQSLMPDQAPAQLPDQKPFEAPDQLSLEAVAMVPALTPAPTPASALTPSPAPRGDSP